MKTKKTFLEAIQVTEKLINDFIFMCDSRMKSTYFTRKGNNKLNFKSIILLNLNFGKKSIQIELDEFFELLNQGKTIKRLWINSLEIVE